MLPGARFVLNTRNLDDVSKSKWWARNPDARHELELLEKQYVDALAALGGAGFDYLSGLEVEFHLFKLENPRLAPADATWPPHMFAAG